MIHTQFTVSKENVKQLERIYKALLDMTDNRFGEPLYSHEQAYEKLKQITSLLIFPNGLDVLGVAKQSGFMTGPRDSMDFVF